MAVIAAFMVPHPPMIVPEVGRGSQRQIEKTIKAYEKVADEIAALIALCILIIFIFLRAVGRSAPLLILVRLR